MKNNLGALLLWISNKLNKNQAELVTKIDYIQNLFKTAGEATATPADMLEGQTAYNGTALITGTMPIQGTKEETLLAGEVYNIPRGYHDGEGTVTATDLTSQTPGSASAAEILSGLKAWVSGEQITGTMPDRRATTVEAAAVTQDDEYTYLDLPEGEACYSGNSKVRVLNSDIPETMIINASFSGGMRRDDPSKYQEGIRGNIAIPNGWKTTDGSYTESWSQTNPDGAYRSKSNVAAGITDSVTRYGNGDISFHLVLIRA